jgi:aspartyl-tRNA(Asn)/glutamyl-tRNA(Gln) amidotransferase subunit A
VPLQFFMDGLDPAALTISSAIDLIHAGKISAASLTGACRRQIGLFNPSINAFVCMVDESRNKTGEGSIPVPVAVKDLIDIAGYPTTAGSPKFFGDPPAAADAHVIQRIRQAGATLIGKTNTHEIALGVTGVNPHLGPVRNPHNLTRVTGGSSSGSAAAVATGMCLAALGTDTGGSIRIPAALCGVVGLKPTYGRVSTRGVIPLSWNLDHVGPLTRSVRDAATMLQVMAGFDEADPASVNVPVDDYLVHLEDGVTGWRVGLAMGEYFDGADSNVLQLIRDAARVFGGLGAKVSEVDLSFLADAANANAHITRADAAAFHRERMATHPDWFGEDVLTRLRTGAACTSIEYTLAHRTQAEMKRRMELFFSDYDILLTPTTPITAPPVDGTHAVQAALQLTRFTAPFNLTGLPALSLPCGWADGLPVGLQIVSDAWGEAKVLRAGRAYERAANLNMRPACLDNI